MQSSNLQPANMVNQCYPQSPFCSQLLFLTYDPSMSLPLVLPLNIRKFSTVPQSPLKIPWYVLPSPRICPISHRKFALANEIWLLVTQDSIVPLPYKVSGWIFSRSHSSYSCTGPPISVPGVLGIFTLSHLQFAGVVVSVCVSVHLIYPLSCS